MSAQIIDLVENREFRTRQAQRKFNAELDWLKASYEIIGLQADLIALQAEMVWLSALAFLPQQQPKKEPTDAA